MAGATGHGPEEHRAAASGMVRQQGRAPPAMGGPGMDQDSPRRRPVRILRSSDALHRLRQPRSHGSFGAARTGVLPPGRGQPAEGHAAAYARMGRQPALAHAYRGAQQAGTERSASAQYPRAGRLPRRVRVAALAEHAPVPSVYVAHRRLWPLHHRGDERGRRGDYRGRAADERTDYCRTRPSGRRHRQRHACPGHVVRLRQTLAGRLRGVCHDDERSPDRTAWPAPHARGSCRTRPGSASVCGPRWLA